MNVGSGTTQMKEANDGNAQEQLGVALVFSQTFEKGGMEDAESGGKKWRGNEKEIYITYYISPVTDLNFSLNTSCLHLVSEIDNVYRNLPLS